VRSVRVRAVVTSPSRSRSASRCVSPRARCRHVLVGFAFGFALRSPACALSSRPRRVRVRPRAAFRRVLAAATSPFAFASGLALRFAACSLPPRPRRVRVRVRVRFRAAFARVRAVATSPVAFGFALRSPACSLPSRFRRVHVPVVVTFPTPSRSRVRLRIAPKARSRWPAAGPNDDSQPSARPTRMR
jgi:hypothetical protein